MQQRQHHPHEEKFVRENLREKLPVLGALRQRGFNFARKNGLDECFPPHRASIP